MLLRQTSPYSLQYMWYCAWQLAASIFCSSDAEVPYRFGCKRTLQLKRMLLHIHACRHCWPWLVTDLVSRTERKCSCTCRAKLCRFLAWARASGCDFAWGDTSWAISALQDAHTHIHIRGKGKYEKESKFQKGTIQLNLIAIGNIKSSHHPLRCQIDRKEKIVHRMYSRLLG